MTSVDAPGEVRDSLGAPTSDEGGIGWSDYATRYDLMAEHNPAYNENIELLLERLERWKLPSDAKICDLGAGTGNYILRLAHLMPEAEFWHVDCDSTMITHARKKYARLGHTKINIVKDYIQRVALPENSFDLVLCVNALYAMTPQESTLRKVTKWLKPGGKFFVIDFGRKQRVTDWGWYLLRNIIRDRGLGGYIKFLVRSGEIIRQARNGTRFQTDGGYWLHTTQEFGKTLGDAGFLVEDLFPCYRGYCDLAVCTLPD